MAVQQNKPTRSKRGMRRSHDALTVGTLSKDQTSDEIHLRHHVTKEGYYRGRKVIFPTVHLSTKKSVVETLAIRVDAAKKKCLAKDVAS